MEAYTSEIKVFNDDNELIAVLTHDIDDAFNIKLVGYQTSKDLRFIADVVDTKELTSYIYKDKVEK